jgi:tripartite-type tricarboxylate transporter receptor subunit TctC
MKKTIATILATTALLAVTVAQAQDSYPSQNIRFVVPFTAGSATDTLARLLANRMTTILGRNIVVENIAGGNGIPASQNVVRAAPDGHTVMITSNTTHAGNQALLKKCPMTRSPTSSRSPSSAPSRLLWSQTLPCLRMISRS